MLIIQRAVFDGNKSREKYETTGGEITERKSRVARAFSSNYCSADRRRIKRAVGTVDKGRGNGAEERIDHTEYVIDVCVRLRARTIFSLPVCLSVSMNITARQRNHAHGYAPAGRSISSTRRTHTAWSVNRALIFLRK